MTKCGRRGAGGPALHAMAALATIVLMSSGWSQEKPAAQKPPQSQQKPPEGFRIGVEVNLVTVPVTVRNPSGGFVHEIPKEAFRILEDGEEQEIVSFAQEGVPARIAIVLDISGSVRQEWGSIKYSTRKFAENLKEDDQFALITFNTETRLKMDWGHNVDRIDPVLTSVYCKDNTRLWDAIWVVSNEVFKGIREKKAMIIMSDGLDNESSVSYKDCLEAAIRSEAAVYVVSKTEAVKQAMLSNKDYQAWYGGVPYEAFQQADLALRKLAYETGARVLYPNNFGQLDNIYAQVDEELRNQYTIGYVSSNQHKDGGYRRIEVAVAAPGARVSARPGYYAPNESSSGRPR